MEQRSPLTQDSFVRLQRAERATATPRNEAEAIAGTYAKGRLDLHGMAITLENARNSVRSGTSEDGKRWENRMQAAYGELDGTTGNDGDPVDCFIGPFPESRRVWVINQAWTDGGFDEHKTMLGFLTEGQARAAYLGSFDRDWQGLQSIVACSISQLKWWLAHGDMRRPLSLDQLPFDGTTDMEKTFWTADAEPVNKTLHKLMYELRVDDSQQNLLLDAVTMADFMADPEFQGERMVLDALVVEVGRMTQKMDLLQRVMAGAGGAVQPVRYTISDPVRSRGVLMVAVLFELSDGQAVTIWFHNPDTTPAKLTPMDDLISWKWMLNKKDVTIVIAPERGKELNVREVARRVMKLAERNSAKFQQANANAAAAIEQEKALDGEIVTLEGRLNELQGQIEVARVAKEDADARAAADDALHYSDKISRLLMGQYGWTAAGNSGSTSTLSKTFEGTSAAGEVSDSGTTVFASWDDSARYLTFQVGFDNVFDMDARDKDVGEFAAEFNRRADAWAEERRAAIAAKPQPQPQPADAGNATGLINGDGEPINTPMARRVANIAGILVNSHGFKLLSNDGISYALRLQGKYSPSTITIGVDRTYPDAFEFDTEYQSDIMTGKADSDEAIAESIAEADFNEAHASFDINGNMSDTYEKDGSPLDGKPMAYVRAAFMVQDGADAVGASVNFGDFNGSMSGSMFDAVTGGVSVFGLTAQIHSAGTVWARAEITEAGAVTLYRGAAGTDVAGEPKTAAEVSAIVSQLIAQKAADDAAKPKQTAEATPPADNELARVNALKKLVSKDAIKSDDPDAIAKLQAKLDYLMAYQAMMVKTNKALRAGKDSVLTQMGYNATTIEGLKQPDYAGRIGFPDYMTANNNGEITRTRKRLKALQDEAMADMLAARRSPIDAVDAAYTFASASDAFKEAVAGSVGLNDYSAFKSAMTIDKAAQAAGMSVSWDVAGAAVLDSASEMESFDSEEEWSETPEYEAAEGAQPMGVFRGNQYRKAHEISGPAVRASVRAKRAEKAGDEMALAKAHKSAYHAHSAAAEEVGGKSQAYHQTMAKFHAERAGILDAVKVLDAVPGDDLEGVIRKDGAVVGRVGITSGDGKALIYLGAKGEERVKPVDGDYEFRYSEDDRSQADMVRALAASLEAPQAEDQAKLAGKRELLQDFLAAQPNSPNADSWRAELARINSIIGDPVNEAGKKSDKLDRKVADDGAPAYMQEIFDLQYDWKNGGALGTARQIGVFKTRLRAVAKKVPASDEKAVFYVDDLTNKIFGPDYDPKVSDIQFKEEAPAQGAGKYRYGLTNRPLSIGTAPKGWVATEEAPAEHADMARHGIVVYDRRLSPEEVAKFELAPVIDGDKARNGVAASFVESLGGYAGNYAEMVREGADSDVADMLRPNFKKFAIKTYGGPVSAGSWAEMSGRILGTLMTLNGGATQPETKEPTVPTESPEKAADRAYLQSLIDGTGDLLAADTFDRMEPLFARYEGDAEMMAMLEKAATVYGDAAVAAAQAAMAPA